MHKTANKCAYVTYTTVLSSPPLKIMTKKKVLKNMCAEILYTVYDDKNGSHILIIDIDIPFYVFWKPHFAQCLSLWYFLFSFNVLQGYYEISMWVSWIRLLYFTKISPHVYAKNDTKKTDKLYTVQILVFFPRFPIEKVIFISVLLYQIYYSWQKMLFQKHKNYTLNVWKKMCSIFFRFSCLLGEK